MTLPVFLNDLFEHGRVRVAAPGEISDTDRRRGADVLTVAEEVHRSDLPDGLPEFDADAAIWAAEMLYRAAQFQVFRDVNVEFIAAAFAAPGPDATTPEAHYSVDLTFQYLHDVVRLARAAVNADPLITELAGLVRPWPLSAVGIPESDAIAWQALPNNRALRIMYVDRILARHDERLLNDPDVQSAVRTACGAFPELAPIPASDPDSEISEHE